MKFAIALTNSSFHAGSFSAFGGRVVDVEKHLRLRAGDRDVLVAAEGIENAADRARASSRLTLPETSAPSLASGPSPSTHRLLHLAQREGGRDAAGLDCAFSSTLTRISSSLAVFTMPSRLMRSISQSAFSSLI